MTFAVSLLRFVWLVIVWSCLSETIKHINMGDRKDSDSDCIVPYFPQCLLTVMRRPRPPSWFGHPVMARMIHCSFSSLLNKVLYAVGNFWDSWNFDVIQHNDILSDEDVDSFGKMIYLLFN